MAVAEVCICTRLAHPHAAPPHLSRPHAGRLMLRTDFHARRERPPRRTTHAHTRTVSFHMRGESLPRSIPMELHTRVELIDTLLEDAAQKTTALQHALAAQARVKEAREHAYHDTPLPHEVETLKYEQDLWQRVRTNLTEVRTLLEDIEELERQRGLNQ